MAQFHRYAAAVAFLEAICGCGPKPAAAAPEEDRLAAIETMYQGYRAEFPEVPEIDAAGLKARRDEVILVDVRTVDEQGVSIIPGAITQAEFEAHKDEYKDKDIVTYCTIGYRSGLAAKELGSEGFHAFNLKGSVLAWAHSGGEFVDAEGKPTRRVHVYGKEWNLLPDDYEPVW